MVSRLFAPRSAAARILLGLACALCLTTILGAQPSVRNPIEFAVDGLSQQLEMTVNTSRILTLEKKIPRAQVNNPDIVRLTPLSANQIQVAALSPGVTQVNLWDDEDNVYTVDLLVYGDSQELDMLLQSEFPDATLRVRPLKSSVVISGYVPRPDMVSRITTMAEDYYPKVIPNMTVGGVQTVLLHVEVMEVSRTKLRAMGVDWANVNDNANFVVSSVSGLIDAATASTGSTLAGAGTDSVRFGVIDGSNSFMAFIKALRQYNLVKVLAEPTLVTMSGRPASFLVGGEFPILVPSGLGTSTIEFREFGTRIDFVPIVLGNGNLRLEVRPTVSEIDESRNVVIGGFTVPGLRTRSVDTAVEMRGGQTLAIAGLIQERIEMENRGIPWLADIPYIGAAFRRVQETVNEIELLIVVTPELVDAMDPREVPPCRPGEITGRPNDIELYGKGFPEVPRCCPDGSCSSCREIGGPITPMATEPPADLAIPPSLPTSASRRRPASIPIFSSDQNPAAERRVGSGQSDMPPSPSSRRIRPAAPADPLSDRHNLNNSVEKAPGTPHISASSEPSLTRPLGYDVQNK